MRKLAWVGLTVSLLACSSSNKKKPPDAPAFLDAPIDARVCGGTLTAPAPSFEGKDTTNAAFFWIAKLPTQIDGNDAFLQWEFYGNIEPSLKATFDLSMGNQSNYKTCAVCLHAFTVDAMGQPVKDFFQFAGTATFTKDPIADQELAGSVTGLQIQEVTISQSDFTSTPVPGGTCNGISDQSNVDSIAAATGWTCTAPKYQDGTTCDCMCGAADPDCSVDMNTIMGCTVTGQTCWNGMCETPPPNDTCQTAAATLAVNGTAVTGTTIGAHRNYDMGLDTATCTNLAQPGPDVVYSVTLTAATQYTFTLSGLDAMYDGSLSLVGPDAGTPGSICDANPITLCVKGADVGLAGANETFQYTPTATGTYFVIVDSGFADGPASAGAFTLAVTSP